MKVTYNPEVDVLRILFRDVPIEESDEDKLTRPARPTARFGNRRKLPVDAQTAATCVRRNPKL